MTIAAIRMMAPKMEAKMIHQSDPEIPATAELQPAEKRIAKFLDVSCCVAVTQFERQRSASAPQSTETSPNLPVKQDPCDSIMVEVTLTPEFRSCDSLVGSMATFAVLPELILTQPSTMTGVAVEIVTIAVAEIVRFPTMTHWEPLQTVLYPAGLVVEEHPIGGETGAGAGGGADTGAEFFGALAIGDENGGARGPETGICAPERGTPEPSGSIPVTPNRLTEQFAAGFIGALKDIEDKGCGTGKMGRMYRVVLETKVEAPLMRAA
jgi:hypothetical protein